MDFKAPNPIPSSPECHRIPPESRRQTFLERRDELVFHVPSVSLFEAYRETAWSDTETVESVAVGLDWTESHPFDSDAVEEAAKIHAELAAGTPINAAHVMIAGICRSHGAALATRDGYFETVDGLETLSY